MIGFEKFPLVLQFPTIVALTHALRHQFPLNPPNPFVATILIAITGFYYCNHVAHPQGQRCTGIFRYDMITGVPNYKQYQTKGMHSTETFITQEGNKNKACFIKFVLLLPMPSIEDGILTLQTDLYLIMLHFKE